MTAEKIPWFWMVVGFTGQTLFFGRMLVQWIVSEIKRASVLPVMFWWFSIGGGVLLLCYAIHRQDPVFILGQCGGVVVYTRNLMLIRRQRKTAAATPDPAG